MRPVPSTVAYRGPTPTRAWAVLRAIDDALITADHNPRLFADQLHAGRSCLQLSLALERYKRARQPVGHERPTRNEPERVPLDWEKQEARERAAAFEITRRKSIDRRRTQRARSTLLERHQRVLGDLARLSTVGAGSVAPSRAGAHDSADLAQLRRAAQTVDLRHPERLMLIAVASYEAVLDEELGLGAGRELTAMIGIEKDRMILLELEGWSPAEIEVIYQGALGSARTIQRVRRKANRSPRDGRPLRFAGDWDSRGAS